ILRRIAGSMFRRVSALAPTDVEFLADKCTDRETSRQFFAHLCERIASDIAAARNKEIVNANPAAVRRGREGARAFSPPRPTFAGLLESGTVDCVAGNAALVENGELKVQAQFQANRYVGIGVVLDSGNDEGFVRFNRVFPKSPAAYAGIRDGDSIE